MSILYMLLELCLSVALSGGSSGHALQPTSLCPATAAGGAVDQLLGCAQGTATEFQARWNSCSPTAKPRLGGLPRSPSQPQEATSPGAPAIPEGRRSTLRCTTAYQRVPWALPGLQVFELSINGFFKTLFFIVLHYAPKVMHVVAGLFHSFYCCLFFPLCI